MTLALENGWSLVGPIRWSVAIKYADRGRIDTLVLPLGLSNSLSWMIRFGQNVRGGRLQLNLAADVRHTDGRVLHLEVSPQGAVTAQNPLARDVRLALEAEPSPDPLLPGFLFKAIAYHATTQVGSNKSAIVYRPFNIDGPRGLPSLELPGRRSWSSAWIVLARAGCP